MGLRYDIRTCAYKGYLKARVLLTLSEDGDQMIGTDKIEIFNADGNLVFAVPRVTRLTRASRLSHSIKQQPLLA